MRLHHFLVLARLFLPTAVFAASDIHEERFSDLPGQMRTRQGAVSYHPQQTNEQAARLPQPLGYGDALRTHALSRATVTITNGSDLYLSELTRLAIVAATDRLNVPTFDLRAGRVRFSGRGGPASTPFRAPMMAGVNKGTEFLVEVEPERTVVTVFEGEAELTNADTPQPVRVRSGQQGIAVPAKAIEVRAVIEANSIVQWWIYYPGILDPDEIGFAAEERALLDASFSQYRAGDLQAALKLYPGYPTPPDPTTEAQRLYYSGLLLAVGAVARAEDQLRLVNSNAPLARALRTMIGAVASPPKPRVSIRAKSSPASTQDAEILNTASELLARSYVHQAAHDLDAALRDARAAVAQSTNFAFGWARVAELEFGFGRTKVARQAVERALALAPCNAQAVAVKGFLLAADYQFRQAIAVFDEAIALDSGLGNAWLGRGLCRRRIDFLPFVNHKTEITHPPAWLSDLQTAASLEPDRSLFRSYASKAFSELGNNALARKELDYASQLDPDDPTPWLYSALLNHEQNRINESVRDLERSIDLNDNRAVHRSRLLLDQDHATRSANLARIYQDAGLEDVALREAAKAVSYDYGNYAGHLLLAESYDALRDPTRFHLRHETAWFNELLLANLLAPVGAGTFSQNISQQEYGRLFEANRLGLSSSTEYRSDGQWRERATHAATLGRFGYALDVDYQHNDGVRRNNELDRLEWYSTLKYQLTARDTLFALIKVQNYHSGDNFQHVDASTVRPHFTYDEEQHPIAVAGYHREWSPGSHTLLLGGRLENDQRFRDERVPALMIVTNSLTFPVGAINFIDDASLPHDLRYRGRLEIYTAEGQQIVENEHHRLIVGARGQVGDFRTQDQLTLSSTPPNPDIPFPPVTGDHTEDFQRITGYGYWTWKPFSSLQLTPGVSYDAIRFPQNFRHPPIGSGEETSDLLAPKAAIVWSPLKALTLRGAWSRELGGASLDESFRLEPVQLAGFSQASRTFISESLVGSVTAPQQEIAALAADVKLPTRTYLGLELQDLHSRVRRTIGVFDSGQIFAPGAGDTPQHLDYRERGLHLALHQLLGAEWTASTLYHFTRTDLAARFPEIPPALYSTAHTRQEADLHQVTLRLQYQHESGFFARAEADWYEQSARTAAADGVFVPLNSDSFWQVNFYTGWRFRRHRGDLTLGVLNLAGKDYHLSPITPTSELPRERVFYARLRLNF